MPKLAFPVAALVALSLGACSSGEELSDEETEIVVDGPTDAVIDFTLELARRGNVGPIKGSEDRTGATRATVALSSGASEDDLVAILRSAAEHGLSYDVGPLRLIAAN